MTQKISEIHITVSVAGFFLLNVIACRDILYTSMPDFKMEFKNQQKQKGEI